MEDEPFARKWVRVMCDVFADGVWNDRGEGCVLDDVPISDELKARFREWQDWYDRDAPQIPGDDPTRFDIEAFSRIGFGLASDLKAELPDWTVIYFDEKRAQDTAAKPTGVDRSQFEYEILPSNRFAENDAYGLQIDNSEAEGEPFDFGIDAGEDSDRQ